MKQLKQLRPYLLEVGIAATAALVLAAVVLLLFARGPSAPLHYTEAEYVPSRAVYAPGDTLVFTPTLEVRQAGRVTVLRSYWNQDKDQSARLCDGSPAPIEEVDRNLPAGIVGDVRGGRSVEEVVPNLPPGNYLLLTSASGPDGGQSVYEVKFSITEPC